METLFPPFEPETPGPRASRFRGVSLRVLIPNVITLLALCAGMTAIRLAIENDGRHLDLAIGCIVVAALLDAIDGRIARYLKGTSRFGAELDSLADFVKEKRREANLSQEEFAERAGVALTVVRKIEQGKGNLNLEKVNQVLKMFGHELAPVEIKKIISYEIY